MASVGYVDLHTHTTASDGFHSPADNVRLAQAAGLAAVAVTDHDTVAGVAEAQAEGERLGVIVVPGVEVSTAIGRLDIHVLGYYCDLNDQRFLSRLQQLRDARSVRNEAILRNLRKLGLAITIDDVLRCKGTTPDGGRSIGRPHIADALVERGAVASRKEAFDRYLGKGAAAFAQIERITPEQAAGWIHEAGGTAVLAHPGLYGNDDEVERLAAGALDGIEVFHSDHSPEQEARYAALAGRYNLITTAGSDFHGARNGESYRAAIGSKQAPLDVLNQLNRKK